MIYAFTETRIHNDVLFFIYFLPINHENIKTQKKFKDVFFIFTWSLKMPKKEA